MNLIVESYAALQRVRRIEKRENPSSCGAIFMFAALAFFLLQPHPALAQSDAAPSDPFAIKETSWTDIESHGKPKTPNPIEIKDSSWINAEELAKSIKDVAPKISLPFLDLELPRKVEKKAAVVDETPKDPGTAPLDPFMVNHENWKTVKNYAKDVDPYVTVVKSSEAKDALKKEINEEDLAVPLRPLNLAPLPTVKDRVASANNGEEEVAEATEAPKAIDYENTKIGPKDESWQNLSMAARSSSQSKLAIDRESSKLIRLAALPGNKTLVSAPAGSATESNMSRSQKIAKTVKQETAPTPAPEPEPKTQTAQVMPASDTAEMSDDEVRAAIEAYRKKQLEAIAHDNKTLAALHAAIANLGVSNKINFVKTKGSASASTETKQPASAPSKGTN